MAKSFYPKPHDIWVEDIDSARELLKVCGYPVYSTKWATCGGGAVNTFQTDEEVITFAQNMQRSIDKRIEEMFGSEKNFDAVMKKMGWLDD